MSATTATRLRARHVFEQARASYEELADRPPTSRARPLSEATTQERGAKGTRHAELYAAAIEAEKAWRDTI